VRKRFIIVDNAFDDETLVLFAAMPDGQLYRATGSFVASHFGFDWLHPLLDELADNHWTLNIDADELFAYPYCGQIGLHGFCQLVEQTGGRLRVCDFARYVFGQDNCGDLLSLR
jgi:hypothetical protein